MAVSRKIIAVIGDTHCGYSGALMPPDVLLLDDTGPEPRTWTPPSTQIQRWEYGYYPDDVQWVFDLAGRNDVTMVGNGDLTAGTHFAGGLVSSRLADQYTIALAVLEPWYKHRNLKRVYLTEGTEVHEWNEGSAPIMIGAELARRYPKVRTKTARHWLLKPESTDISLDIAHHGPGQSRRIHLSGDELRRYVRNIMIAEVAAGRKPPDVILRAHVHVPVGPEPVTFAGHLCYGVVAPSYSGMSLYAQKRSQSTYQLTCGMTAVEVVDGRVLGVHTRWHTLDLRQEGVV